MHSVSSAHAGSVSRRWLRLVLAVCLILGVAWIAPHTVPRAAAASAPTDSPAPADCATADGTERGDNTWCLRWSNPNGSAKVPTLGTFTVHLKAHSDTTLQIPVPLGGLRDSTPEVDNSEYTSVLRDPATNGRVDAGDVEVDQLACATRAASCTWVFRHDRYPVPPPSDPPFPAPNPAWLFGEFGYLTANGCCTAGYGEFAIHIIYDDGGPSANLAPTAAFDTHPNTKVPGQYQFVSDSTDPNGAALTSKWTLGDGATATGPAVTHTYAKPGTYHVRLTVTDPSGLSNSVTHDVVVTAPTLAASLVFVDAAGHVLPTVSPQVGDTVRVRLTVSAADDGVGPVHGIGFTGDPLTVSPAGLASVTGPTPSIPSSLQLAPGATQSFVYTLKSLASGAVRMTSAPDGTDASGGAVDGGTAQLSYGISGIKVELSLTPNNYTEDEDADGPTPVLVTVTEKISNISDGPITGLNVRSVDAVRTKAGELLRVTGTGGVQPDPVSGYPLDGALAAGASRTVTSTFTVADDGKIEFRSLVTGASPAGATLRGFGTSLLTAKPKYYFSFTSRVIRPAEGVALPAGDPITITGTLHNLTDGDTLDIGPLYAELAGNAGVQGLAYNGVGVDPRALAATGGLTLDPGDSKTFTLKILTAYSQPDGDGGVLPSGGNTARVTFTPWAKVTQDDGTTFTTKEDGSQVLATDNELVHVVHIDDSVPMPVKDPRAVVGGVLYGGIEGVWNLAAGFATGIVKLPYAFGSAVGYGLIDAGQYEARVWDTFTNAEKAHFSEHVGDLAVAYLQANIGTAADGIAVLHERVTQFTQQYMAKIRYQWDYGDYATAAKTYSSMVTTALGNVIVPAIWGELAKSGEAVSALDEAEAALKTKVADLTQEANSATTVEKVVPLLTKIASGTPIDGALAEKLYGISPVELAELQKLAEKYQILLTVRSRSTTSLDWLAHYKALMKPEALKIKSVSALDIQLGYPAKLTLKGYKNVSPEGALVFKEPTPLIQARNGEGALSELVPKFVEERGFTPGTAEYDNAVERVNERIEEWNKYAKDYQEASKRGWIDVGFNWKGNAMADPTRSGSGKFAGFRLRPTGTEGEYVVEMYNFEAKRFVPVTGDIDPIAFTRLDGSPLTPTQHAALLNDLRMNPILRTQHGESATYTKGGLEFIQKQFKPGEAALQLGPAGTARAVRLDVAQSTWTSATDYRLVWDEGVISSGGEPVVDAVLQSPWAELIAPERPAPPGVTLPLPGNGKTVGVNVGRCSTTYSTSSRAPALIMGASGTLDQLSSTGTTVSPLERVCFSEGPVVAVDVRPVTAVSRTVPAGATEVPIASGPGVAAADPSGQDDGFQIGQQVVIGAGTPDAESATISAFGSLIFSHGLQNTHAQGEVIVVTRPVAGPVPSESATPAERSAGGLAATGTPVAPLAPVGGLLLLSGAGAIWAGRRRRTATRSKRAA